MIYSRYLVSDSRRVSRSPFRWLSDLARRGSLSYPAGQGPRHKRIRGKHMQKNILVRQQLLGELAAAATKEYDRNESIRQLRELIQRYNEVAHRVPR